MAGRLFTSALAVCCGALLAAEGALLKSSQHPHDMVYDTTLPCKAQELRSGVVAGPKLTGYLVEFPNSPNIQRLRCQLGASFNSLNLEAAVKSTQEDWKAWKERGLIAPDHILGGWNREPLKAASVFMNHVDIWRQHVVSRGDTWAGIFEGDTVISEDFHEVFADLRQRLRSGELPETDIIYLGHCLNNDCAGSGFATLHDNVSLVRSLAPVCSHAYLVSRKGAQILLDNAFPIRDNNDRVPMMSLIKEGKLQSLSLCPTIARQADKRFNATLDTKTRVMMWAYHHKAQLIPVGQFFMASGILVALVYARSTFGK